MSIVFSLGKSFALIPQCVPAPCNHSRYIVTYVIQLFTLLTLLAGQGMWAVGFHTNVNQTNKQTKFCTGQSAKSLQFCRWYEPSLLAASVLYKFSMTMDHISIILATIALAGIITRRVTYVNIINQFQPSCFGRFGGSSTPKRHPRFSGGQLEMAEDRRIDMTDMCQNLSFLSFLTDYFRSFLFQNNLLE